MLLRHATPRKNIPSICKAGLLFSKSQGRLPAVWLHAPGKTAWALIHVVKRHSGRVEDVVVIELDVPRNWLRRSRRGLWYSRSDLPPVRFRRVIDFAAVAGPSADGGQAALKAG